MSSRPKPNQDHFLPFFFLASFAAAAASFTRCAIALEPLKTRNNTQTACLVHTASSPRTHLLAKGLFSRCCCLDFRHDVILQLRQFNAATGRGRCNAATAAREFVTSSPSGCGALAAWISAITSPHARLLSCAVRERRTNGRGHDSCNR